MGDRYGGLFSNSDSLSSQLLDTSKEINELLWRLPLDKSNPHSIINPILRAANKAWYYHIRSLNIPFDKLTRKLSLLNSLKSEVVCSIVFSISL